jgi:hypothetical protein
VNGPRTDHWTDSHGLWRKVIGAPAAALRVLAVVFGQIVGHLVVSLEASVVLFISSSSRGTAGQRRICRCGGGGVRNRSAVRCGGGQTNNNALDRSKSLGNFKKTQTRRRERRGGRTTHRRPRREHVPPSSHALAREHSRPLLPPLGRKG